MTRNTHRPSQPLLLSLDGNGVHEPCRTLAGSVRLLPCRPEYASVTVFLVWRVHGRGAPLEERIETVTLDERPPGPDEAAIREYAFRFRLPNGPPSYRGTLMDLDWYVVARGARGLRRADTAEARFRLLAGDALDSVFRPLTFQPVRASASGRRWIERLGRGAGQLVARSAALGAWRTGAIELDVFPDDPRPGEPLGFEVRFVPPFPLVHGRIAVVVRCVEQVSRSQPSGTVVTRRERFRHTVILADPSVRRAGEPVVLRGGLRLPARVPPTLRPGRHDRVRWRAELQVPIRRWVPARHVEEFRVHPAPERLPRGERGPEEFMPLRPKPVR